MQWKGRKRGRKNRNKNKSETEKMVASPLVAGNGTLRLRGEIVRLRALRLVPRMQLRIRRSARFPTTLSQILRASPSPRRDEWYAHNGEKRRVRGWNESSAKYRETNKGTRYTSGRGTRARRFSDRRCLVPFYSFLCFFSSFSLAAPGSKRYRSAGRDPSTSRRRIVSIAIQSGHRAAKSVLIDLPFTLTRRTSVFSSLSLSLSFSLSSVIDRYFIYSRYITNIRALSPRPLCVSRPTLYAT